MASTVLAMKSRRWLPLRALAVSMRTGIISGSGRISVAPGPLVRSPQDTGRFPSFKPLTTPDRFFMRMGAAQWYDELL